MRARANYDKVFEALKNIIKGTPYENHVFTVGGCERDRIIGGIVKDVDITIDRPNGAIEFAHWLKENGYTEGSIVVYEHFGTAMFTLKEAPFDTIEAVQTRKECYRDMESRNPETAFGTIMEDCQRRDFTINAIYRNISTGEVLDLNGKSFYDINQGLIRTCGDPDIIFSEDPLRILRAIRFKSRLNFTIEKSTFDGMRKHLHRLSIISRERITDEFTKMLQTSNAYSAVKLLSDIEALKYVIPCDLTEEELSERICASGVIDSLDLVPKNIEIQLSRIFLKFTDKETEDILKKMRASNDVIKEVVWYKNHSDPSVIKTMKGLRKFLYECEKLPRFIHSLNIFSFYGVDKTETYSFALHNVGSKMFGYKLPINGNDVMEALNVKGGPIIKTILDELLDYAFYDPDITKEECINYIKEHYVE